MAKKYRATAGQHIHDCCLKMCDLANQAGEPVASEFNGVEIVVMPGEIPSAVEKRWSDEMERCSKAYAESPEGIESAKRQAERQKRADASVAEGIKPFQMKDADTWQKCLNTNRDGGYGEAVYRFASRWANAMDAALVADGVEQSSESAVMKWIVVNAQKICFKVDQEGITGFMYGCAVGILSQVWVHGEQLRRWQNKDTQIGIEGDEANEKGGVLNPALLRFGSD